MAEREQSGDGRAARLGSKYGRKLPSSGFDTPLRALTIGSFKIVDPDLLAIEASPASHIYVHVTDTCPVECPHCMYSSRNVSNPQGFRGDSFGRLLAYLRDADAEKLTLSGGGEPFEDEDTLMALVARARCGALEIDTSGVWANDSVRLEEVLGKLDRAAGRTAAPVTLRISADRFHMSTGKVSLDSYRDIAMAWTRLEPCFGLCFRGLAVEDDDTLTRLAGSLGGSLEMRTRFNGAILADGRAIPVTRNVLRFSGRGRSLMDSQRMGTAVVGEYYRSFLGDDVRLGLVVNDAAQGVYRDVGRPAVTINYDGRAHLFSATPPDRRPSINEYGYQESLAYLFQDPIVVFLSSHPMGEFLEMAAEVAPFRVQACVNENDYCLMTEKLLSTPVLEGYLSGACLVRLAAEGAASADRGLLDGVAQGMQMLKKVLDGSE